MWRYSRRAAGAALLVLMFGCESDPVDLVCPDRSTNAVVVDVRGHTDAPPSDDETEGWVEDGDFVDSLRLSWWRGRDPLPGSRYGLAAANGRPGIYDVHARKSGYEPWDATSVTVLEGVCSIDTVHLTAELTPL